MQDVMKEVRMTFDISIRAARRAGTPLVAIRTADPASAMAAVHRSLNGSSETTPIVAWDILSGFIPRTDAGKAAIASMGDGNYANPADALVALRRISPDSISFFHLSHRYWDSVDTIQGIWNLRDAYKATGQMLILLCSRGANLPAELQGDVTVLDEPLPDLDQLAGVVRETLPAAGLEAPDDATVTRATDALLGLAAFPAEQVLAMSLSKTGMDHDRLWERKRQAIEQTKGLSVWRGGETFDSIRGCANVLRFLRAVVHGEKPPRVVCFVDEIEKAFAGTGTDTSGVKTELTGTLLSWMQDHEAEGSIFIGPPGAAKSAVAKAVGGEAGIPTIAFDLAGMQSSLVGSSGENLRTALQVVDSISGGRSLWIATCNSIGTLPPELRRRFTLGTFFFDLPTADERSAIWELYRNKYSLPAYDLPPDEGWTGAEIKECCRKASRLRMTLAESAEYIVPIARSAADQIESLRKQASGRFLSASKPGVFTVEGNEQATATLRRAFRELE